MSIKNICPSCNGPKDRRAKLCRACKDKEPLEKACSKCGVIFPISAYNLRPNGRGGHKRRSQCKSCESEYGKQRYHSIPIEKHREYKQQYNKDNPDKVRRWALRSTWKLEGYNPDEIEQFVRSHHGACDICGKSSNGRGRLHIDHDHVTGKLRGMLCHSCNTGLGQFRDNIMLLESAINYLRNNTTGFGPECARNL